MMTIVIGIGLIMQAFSENLKFTKKTVSIIFFLCFGMPTMLKILTWQQESDAMIQVAFGVFASILPTFRISKNLLIAINYIAFT